MSDKRAQVILEVRTVVGNNAPEALGWTWPWPCYVNLSYGSHQQSHPGVPWVSFVFRVGSQPPLGLPALRSVDFKWGLNEKLSFHKCAVIRTGSSLLFVT